jgi:hypothetical protein
MQIRPRIPVIFTLYMVDVLCCALGCIILLWLVNARVANRRALAASETGKTLAATKTTLETTQSNLLSLRYALAASEDRELLLKSQLAQTRLERDHLSQLALQLQKKFDATKKSLDLSQIQLAGLLKDLEKVQAANAILKSGLDAKTKELTVITAQVTAATLMIQGLDKDLLDKKMRLLADAKKIDDLSGRLLISETRLKELEKIETALRLTAKDYREQLALALERGKVLQKDLDQHKTQLLDAGKLAQELFEAKTRLEQFLASREKQLSSATRVLGNLKLENLSLADQLRLARFEFDNRFAGIHMTGSRVVFVIDISGSMRMRDQDTVDSRKWPLVCDEFGRLMRSVPDLTKYQVVVFSDKAVYPFGKRGQWLDFDPKTSVEATVAGLKRITPEGGTNMSAGLAEAFTFRAQGLDTIYFFSDGLPNDGLTLVDPKTGFSEPKNATTLGKYVRHTLRTDWNRPQFRWLQRRVTINTIGFFFESPEVGAFLWALARENNGSFVGMSKP